MPWRRSLFIKPMLGQFCMFHWTLKNSMIGFLSSSEGRPYPFNSLRISGWCTVTWSRWYLKWPCSANFSAFHGTLKFSMIGLDQVWRRYRSNSLSTPVVGLKFGKMVHSNIKQITMKMGMLGKILRVPRNFFNFQNRLGSGPRYDVATLAL